MPLSADSQGPFDLTGARNSVASTGKSKKPRRKHPDSSVLLRTICLPHPCFVHELVDGLCIYISPVLKLSPVFSGGIARISIIPSPSKPAAVQEREKDNATSNDTQFTVARQIVVKAQEWQEAPEGHVGLSPQLATTLGIHGIGDLARYEA